MEQRASKDHERTIRIAEEAAGSEAVRWCFGQYYEELDRRMAGGFRLDAALPLGTHELTPPRGLVLVVRSDGAAVGCGGLKLDVGDVAELKRLWVSEAVRGHRIGGRLLDALEERALRAGKHGVRLETNRDLTEAMSMYRKHGYREVKPFNDEAHAHHWFQKDLPNATGP